jgi:DNA-binding SARP family transcriptional activator
LRAPWGCLYNPSGKEVKPTATPAHTCYRSSGTWRKRSTGAKTEVQEEKRLSIRLLGPPEVSIDEGRLLQFGAKKRLALLCYLAAEGGRRPRRDLAELLWPQSDKRRARADLRSALDKLRKTLAEESAHSSDTHERQGGGGFFVVDGDLLGIEPTEVELDLNALEAAVSLARREASPQAGSSDDGDDALGRRELIGRLRGALGLYRGEFMESFSLEDAPEFELWLEAQRTRWRSVFGVLCERLSRLEGEEGLIGEAIATARLWVRQATLEEAAFRRLMELLSGAGESERALLAYEGFKNTLGKELQMEPSPQMQQLVSRLREEVEQGASLGTGLLPSAATPTISSQLSVLEVPLVGRQEEFGALVSEYQAASSMERARVVAILGEAGIGKTRLAEEFLLWAKARGGGRPKRSGFRGSRATLRTAGRGHKASP